MLGANIKKFVILVTAAMTAACDKSNPSYSLEGESTGFQQSTSYAPKPIDVLWVIDNSGSMQSSQANLTANFQSFISRFQSQQYDFHMAVISTEAWYGKYTSADNPDYRRLRDGSNVYGHSNVFVMDKNTQNLSDVFLKNASLGINGNGDERAFESLVDSLSWSGNTSFNFRRSNAYLAVIILSDEDDFSSTTSAMNNNYNSPNIVPINTYVTWLDTYTGATAATRKSKYSVNTISIQNNACLNQLQDSSQRLGLRYAQLASATEGLNLSLCGDFATNLNLVSSTIESAISEVKLDREPVLGTIQVLVNSVLLPEDPVNGWSYNSTTMILKFNGLGIPPASALVNINYEPAAPKL